MEHEYLYTIQLARLGEFGVTESHFLDTLDYFLNVGKVEGYAYGRDFNGRLNVVVDFADRSENTKYSLGLVSLIKPCERGNKKVRCDFFSRYYERVMYSKGDVAAYELLLNVRNVVAFGSLGRFLEDVVYEKHLSNEVI